MVELQQACPLLLDGHVLLMVVKLGNLARRGRPVRPPDWLSLQAEVDRRVCPCLFQMLRANRLPVLLVASLLLLAASVLLPVGHDPVCLLWLAKPAVPRPRPEPLDPR